MSVEAYADLLLEYKRNPVRFVWDEFGVNADRWQRDVLEAFASNDPQKQRIAMQACAGPGKSAVLAWIAWNFLLCYAEPGEHPKGAAVSVTSDNLRDNFWAELAKWHARSKLLTVAFEWTKERIFNRQYPETWFLSARSFSKTANAEEQGRTLSGLHAKFVLFLIDEAGDINTAVLRAAEQGLSNTAFGKIVVAGNPTSHSGILYYLVNDQSDITFVVRISGDPDDARRSSRIDKDWAQRQIDEYGRDNPWVMAYILGKFPPTSVNALLGPDEVRESMARNLKDDEYDWAAVVLGVDPARFGDDRTVIIPRQGLRAYPPEVMRHARTQEILGKILKGKKDTGAQMIFVDETGGYGAGIIDGLYLGKHPCTSVMFSGKPTDPRYFNKRSEMYFEAAQWVKRGGQLPNIPELVREATAATYYFDKGRLRVEEKDQIKQRIGVSPDIWDAFVTTFASEIAPDLGNGTPGFGAIAPEVAEEVE